MMEASPYLMTLFTCVLAIATIVLAIFTFMMRNEMKENNKILQAPILSVRFEVSKEEAGRGEKISGQYDIVIENVSKNIIYNLKFDKPAINKGIKIIPNDLGLLKHPIDMWPKQVFRSAFLNYYGSQDEMKKDGTIELQFSYKDRKGKQYNDKLRLELGIFWDITSFGKIRTSRLN